MKEYRCPKCKRLLFKSDASGGTVQVPCPRCDAIRLVQVGVRSVPVDGEAKAGVQSR